jgi:predicted transcriptional regulator
MIGLRKRPYHYARKNIVFCNKDDPVTQVAAQMLAEDVGSIIVTGSKGVYTGLLTYQHILSHIASNKGLSNAKVSDLDIDPIIYVNRNAKTIDVIEKFRESPSRRVILTNDDGQIVGVLKESNLVRFSTLMLGPKKHKGSK